MKEYIEREAGGSMTENETIKALERMAFIESRKGEEQKEKVLESAAEIINRQKAEIERLAIELKAMRGAANSYKAKVERLQEQLGKLGEHSLLLIQNVRAEAIKEVAEVLEVELESANKIYSGV